MYAIVSIAGQQFKVEKGKKVFVHRLPGEVGDEVSFDKVLLISQDEKTDVGAPYLPDAFVAAQIISHNRGDKVLVFKKKRRKGYQKLNGHRQDFTQILIGDIAEKGASERSAVKKAEVPVAKASSKDVPAETQTKKTAAAKTPVKKPAKKAKASEKPKKAAVKKPAVHAEKAPAKKAAAKVKTKEKSKK